MPKLDERDLGCIVDDGKRSKDTDETRSGARDYEGGVEMTQDARRNASDVADSAGIKWNQSPIPVALFVVFLSLLL